ncbi:MAG: hypothetical protein IKA36_02190 [Clostridia bacterium]|nr:hypothetical protein [Clostridia bacterium]
MKLPEHKVKFLLEYAYKLRTREFIIDLFTKVGNRPMMEVYPSEMPTESVMEKTISFTELPTDARYAKPWGLDLLPAHLRNDPVHRWRAESGIELVHEEPTVWELIRVARNWLLMNNEQKDESDAKSKELFGVTNQEHFKSILTDWIKAHSEYDSTEGSVVMLTDINHARSCVVYISDIDTSNGTLTYRYLDNGLNRIFSETDTFTLVGGATKSYYQGDPPIETTAGRFLLNILLLEIPFGNAFQYINKAGFDLKGLEASISKELLAGTIKVDNYKQYVDNLFFIGHFTELCVPNFTRASLTTTPDMKKIKDELFKKYEGRLDEPEVIMEIENALISADKAYLKDDDAMRFYAPLGGKPFNVARKKMYCTVGGIEAFSKDSGKFTFIRNSLAEGWDVTQMPAYANEIRKGSYNRGHETQLGGAQTKYIVRVFQDLVLTEKDCHSHQGMMIDFSKYPIKEFIGRYIKDKSNWVEITNENMSKYVEGRYLMRSPMYCKTQNGMCEVCAGKMFSKLDVKHISMYIVDISSTFTTMALKLMHGSKLEMIDLGDLNQYVV